MRVRVSLLIIGFSILFASTAVAQDQGNRVSVTSVIVTEGGASTGQATSLSIGIRRAVESMDGLRYTDPVDLLSTTSVPEAVQDAVDDLEPIADMVRSGDPNAAADRAAHAVAVFEENLSAVRRASLFDAYMLDAIAHCRMDQRRRCIQGFERVLTFREGAEYDTARYPDAYSAVFEETRSRVSAGPRASLRIITNPEGAEVFVDGASFGPSPAIAENLLAGEHYVTVKAVGYEKLVARATVRSRSTESVSLLLQPIARALLLERDLARIPSELGQEQAGPVISGLSGYLFVAQIIVGLISEAPNGELDVGLYLYDLRTRFLLSEKHATIASDASALDRARELTESLYHGVDLAGTVEAPELDDGTPRVVDPARPLWKRWWFWTAVGVVVVSGATAAYLLTRDSGADVPEGFTRLSGSAQ
ncbi:MAG: PEGA domain-containing protein [Sandaracinaceae bacterium]|jgi:hypothetical protein|nr:PEGA domain-containing protein [Sandaracinaceae bacterium]